MRADPRTDEQIRSDIAAEREQLVLALGDLRDNVRAKRRLAVAAGALVTTGLAIAASLRIARRFQDD